jgi:hypothetical protein
MEAHLEWLLDGEPYIRYRTRLDLLGMPADHPDVRADREAMLADPLIQNLVAELQEWPGPVIASHKSARQHFHKLAFLTNLGLTARDAGMPPIIERVTALRSAEGPFALHMNISSAYGGTGRDELAWALCDTPLIQYALLKLGLGDDPRVADAGEYLMALGRTDEARGLMGWPCAVSQSLGSWRGPGKKDDPCPFANLAMLKMAAQHPLWRETPQTRAGAETLLSLWVDSRTRHPYIFYMGDDFRKLKAPFIWYDLLHVLEVLTQLPWLKGDARLEDMLSVLMGKANAQGRFTAESVYQPWAGWEFGQKKAPSRWITLLAHRLLNRRQHSLNDNATTEVRNDIDIDSQRNLDSA